MDSPGILLVANDDGQQGDLATRLVAWGYRLFTAGKSRQAVALGRESRPDLVLLDVEGLAKRGLGICRALRAEPALAEVPLLAAVPAAKPALGQAALEHGADDLILVPFDSVELQARLRAYIRLYHYRQQLDDAVSRHAAETMVLNRIGQVITSVLDLEETLSIIADQAHWLLNVAATSVILIDEETKSMWFGAACGKGAGFVTGKRLEKGKGIVDWVIQHGQPLTVQDVSQDPRFFAEWDQESGFHTQSILCVPLQIQGKTIGAIEAINKSQGAFDDKDLDLLTSLAASAAIAIENARLYDQAQRAEEEIRHLYQELQSHAGDLERMVTERTQQLRVERDRTQAILEALGEAVIVTDLEGRIQYLNPAAVELTGYTLEQATDWSPKLWQTGEQGEEGEQQGAGRPAAPQTQRAEVVSRRKDGSLYDAAMTVAPLFDSNNPTEIVGHVCVQRDISPIKSAERLKDQFVSNVSHELRTPLSVIAQVSGNLDRLYERLSDEKRRRLIHDIREHAQVLNELIGDILEISRIESAHISTERERIDLARLLTEEVEKQRPLAARKHHVLQTSGDECVPVWANGEQLRQAVRNLVNNAIKYTPNGGQVHCDCHRVAGGKVEKDKRERWPGQEVLPQGRWGALRVMDNGIGIDPQDLPYVYERFYRVKTESNIPGTGLGLSIAKELIEAHGGKIAASSAPGQGTVFAVYLPLLEE